MNAYIIVAPTQKEAAFLYRYAQDVLKARKGYRVSSGLYELQLRDLVLRFTTEERYPIVSMGQHETLGKVVASGYFEEKLDEYKERMEERIGNGIV